MTYLDHAATSPLRPEALEAMLPFLKDSFGNPSSAHPLGMAAREAVEAARAQVAALVGADAAEVIFTSGATEANNLAIRGVTRSHAVTTNIEHPSVAATFEALTKRGLALTVVAARPDGVVKAEDILAAVRPETTLVSVMRVNNELGTIQPVEAIAAGLRAMKSRALFHTDAVQSPASLETNMKALGADLLSLSAHKLGGPKGVGALVIRKGVILAPIVTGGGQERGVRSGTENVAGIVGFGTAANLVVHISSVREKFDMLQKALDTALAGSGTGAKRLLPVGTPVASHIAALEVPGADADFLVLLLGREGVMVSAGSACHAGNRDASKILLTIGLSEKRARGVIRVSFGPETKTNDIESFAAALRKVLPKALA